MTKEIWINLPVKDLQKSKEFFRSIGFRIHPQHENNDQMTVIVIGEKDVMVMLVPEQTFKLYTRNDLTDTNRGTEVLFSIDAQTREEVDEYARKAEAAGGNVFGKPSENQGWMYGCGFTDLDGHRWNVLHMDFNKMPKH